MRASRGPMLTVEHFVCYNLTHRAGTAALRRIGLKAVPAVRLDTPLIPVQSAKIEVRPG
jgi:hypothetical protein